MKQTVLKQLSNLPDMSVDELESMWRNKFDEDPPSHKNPDMMRRKLAWRIQEITFGQGLSEDAKKKLQKLRRNPEYGSRKRKRRLPPVGTQYVKYWGGEEHRVMVLIDGYEYKGCKYKSLTPIATLITGTKRSGPAFFKPSERNEHDDE